MRCVTLGIWLLSLRLLFWRLVHATACVRVGLRVHVCPRVCLSEHVRVCPCRSASSCVRGPQRRGIWGVLTTGCCEPGPHERLCEVLCGPVRLPLPGMYLAVGSGVGWQLCACLFKELSQTISQASGF